MESTFCDSFGMHELPNSMLTECGRGACCNSPSSALRSSAGSAVAYGRAAPLNGAISSSADSFTDGPRQNTPKQTPVCDRQDGLVSSRCYGSFCECAMQSYFSADQKKKMNAACRQLSCHSSCVIRDELFITMHPHQHFWEARIPNSGARLQVHFVTCQMIPRER